VTAVWLALALLLGYVIGAVWEGCRRGGSLDLHQRVLRAEIARDDAMDELAARKRQPAGRTLRSVPTAQDGAWIAASLQEHARRNGA